MSAAVGAGGRNQPSIQSGRLNLEIRKNFAFLRIAHHYSMLPRQLAESPSWEISRNEVNRVVRSLSSLHFMIFT